MVKLASSKVESKTETTSSAGSKLTYGPYSDVEAFSTKELRLHFENESPFQTVTWSEREVEVSHWGSVAVEEHFELVHTGAKLKHGFSRLDYQMKNQKGASFQQLISHLPLTATDTYYRDVIGNISTSHVRQSDKDYLVMEVCKPSNPSQLQPHAGTSVIVYVCAEPFFHLPPGTD